MYTHVYAGRSVSSQELAESVRPGKVLREAAQYEIDEGAMPKGHWPEMEAWWRTLAASGQTSSWGLVRYTAKVESVCKPRS